jgi:ABC-type Mn2+/Zn2+ transport system ATPase subunit
MSKMDATALTTAKQNIRQLKKQKAEVLASSHDRKQVRKIQRKVKLLKRQTRALAKEKKLAAAKAAAEAAAKDAAEQAAAAAAKAAEAPAG